MLPNKLKKHRFRRNRKRRFFVYSAPYTLRARLLFSYANITCEEKQYMASLYLSNSFTETKKVF